MTGVVLAGERPGGDPLALALEVGAKALAPVAGQAMGERVVSTLAALMPVRVFGTEALGARLGGVAVEPAARSIAATLRPLLDRFDGPLLVTTADHPLLDAAMVEAFLGRARGHDLAVGLVERGTLLAVYPHNRRTWLHFRGGAYSGANLFWIGSAHVLPLLEVWARVEQRRKRARALVGAFGLFLLFGVALRLLTLEQALTRIGRRFGLSIRAVVLPQAEACIDVDSEDDLALVERILESR